MMSQEVKNLYLKSTQPSKANHKRIQLTEERFLVVTLGFLFAICPAKNNQQKDLDKQTNKLVRKKKEE
jgi:hypothetical protein